MSSARVHAEVVHRHLDAVDGLRAIAVLLVIVFHLKPAWLPGGFVGVDVFFVISGYVVTGSLLRHADAGFKDFVVDFYARRFRRILPALTVCLLATTVFAVALIPTSWLSDAVPTTALAAFLGLSNLALLRRSDGYFAPRTEFNPYTHTWSLGVEEQFYVIYPMLLFVSLRGRHLARGHQSVVVLLTLAAASLAWSAHATENAPAHAYYMLTSRFWELAAGAALCLWQADRLRTEVSRTDRLRRLSVWIGVPLIAIAALWADNARFPFPWALPAVAGTLLVIWGSGGAADTARPAGMLAGAPLVAIGLRSYSLYLWHWPVFTLFRWTVGLETLAPQVAAVVMTTALACASYAWVERPVQRGSRLSRLPSWMVACAGIVLMASGWLVAQRLFSWQPMLSLSVVARDAAAWYPTPGERVAQPLNPLCEVVVERNFQHNEVIESYTPTKCRRPIAASGRLYVLGDSHAGAYRRMLHLLAQDTGVVVTLYTHAGCAVVSMAAPSASRSAECRTFESWALADLSRRARHGDAVMFAALQMERFGDHFEVFKRAGGTAATAEALRARQEGRAEAAEVVSRLSAAGLTVILDAPKPIFGAPAFRCSDWFNASNPICSAGLAMPLERIDENRRETLGAMRALAAAHVGVHIWDTLPLLCPGTVCHALRSDGRPIFFDGDHLSGLSNEMLHAHFAPWLSALLRH